MGKHEPLSGAARTAKWRERMRARGLRPKVRWLPDTSDPAWRAEVARQCRLIAESEQEKDDQAFIESISIWNELPPYDWGKQGPP